MFKKLKDKEVYKKYKEIRSDPKRSARFSLIFWLLFFVAVIFIVRGMGSSSISTAENARKISKYEYTFTNNSRVVFGICDGKTQVFTILDKKYYYDGEKIYLVNGHELSLASDVSLDLLKINIDFIDELTSNITSVINGDNERYLVPLTRFISLYENDTDVDLSFAESFNVIVDKYYKKDSIYMIKINLESYYQYKNIESDGLLTIDIYNVNRVSALEYEKMLGVIK